MVGSGGGMSSVDPAINPIVGGWEIINLYYCDGGSFSGDRIDPININGTRLYFRGRRILEEIVSVLLKRGLSDATHLVITGGSAGELSAYLHANYIGSPLSKGTDVAVISLSGFFLVLRMWPGRTGMFLRMRWVYETHNMTASVAQSNPKLRRSQK
jgi:hypothetical protein